MEQLHWLGAGVMAVIVRRPVAPPPSATGREREPLVYTAVDLSHVAPGMRLAAENAGILTGLLIGLPLSIGLWAVLLMLALR